MIGADLLIELYLPKKYEKQFSLIIVIIWIIGGSILLYMLYKRES